MSTPSGTSNSGTPAPAPEYDYPPLSPTASEQGSLSASSAAGAAGTSSTPGSTSEERPPITTTRQVGNDAIDPCRTAAYEMLVSWNDRHPVGIVCTNCGWTGSIVGAP